MSGPHLVLVGLMGVGKTTVGEQCARQLDRPFVDTDDVVEATAHATVAEIFEQFGEARFRALERQAVADVTSSPVPLVIACGGGAVTDAGSRRALQDAGVVVWLQAPTSVLESRVGRGDGRPLLRGGAGSTLERLASQREPMYEAVAHATVDTSGRSVDEVVAAVFAAAEVSAGWSG